MEFLAAVGAVVITVALTYFTIGFFGAAYFSIGMSGIFSKTEIITLMVGILVFSFLWFGWWVLIGSNITIGFS